MQSPRTAAVLMVLGGLAALVACKNKNVTGVSTGAPAGAFEGTFAGGSVSGVLTLTFLAVASAPAAHRAPFAIVPVANAATVAVQAITISGSLAITGGATYTLTGTYNASANPQLTVSGGGYTITGNYTASNGQLSGSLSGPGGISGQWTVSAGTVKVFCGTYTQTAGGSSSGTWNLTLDTSNRLFGVASTPNGVEQLQGSYTSGNNPNVMVTYNKGSASGNLNPSTGAGSGTWSNSGGGGSGTWTAKTSGC
jgi:hypothetical protein